MSDIWDERPEYREHQLTLELIRDLLKGTPAMRGSSPVTPMLGFSQTAAGIMNGGVTPWLPRFPGDDADSYALRWSRAYSNGAFKDAVLSLGSKPFQEPIVVKGYPEGSVIESVLRDADRAGKSLHRIKRAQFGQKIAYGAAYTWIARPGKDDLPDDALTPSGGVSVPAMARYRVRPYYVPVHPLNVTAWELDDAGKLIDLRIRADRIEDVGGKWELVERLLHYHFGETGKLVRDTHARARGAGSKALRAMESDDLGLDFIPFVWDVASEDDDVELIGAPPLQDLAYLNLQHFQETAEQGVALLFARAEAPVERGASAKDVDKPLNFTIGRAKRTTSTPDKYDLAYVGPSGRGVEHGATSLQRIEERMAQLSAKPLQQRTGNRTATGEAIGEAKAESMADSWARGTEESVKRELRIIDFLAGGAGQIEDRLPDLSVDIWAQAGYSFDRSLEHGRFLHELVQSGKYPDRVFFEDLAALKLLRDGVDIEEVLALNEEAQAKALEREAEIFARMSANATARDTEGEPERAEDGEPASPQR